MEFRESLLLVGHSFLKMQSPDFEWSVKEKSILSELQITIFEKKDNDESVADIMHHT